MTDRLSRERRGGNMSRIRGMDTELEKQVRSALHRAGYRFPNDRALALNRRHVGAKSPRPATTAYSGRPVLCCVGR
jgi:G:T-mismatch repair DNA endonuclease (very short patch repair protein)